MKITRNELRQLVLEQIERDDNYSPEKPFGNVLFGQDRNLPTPEGEPDTENETSLRNSLENHIARNDSWNLAYQIGKLLGLKDKEEYKDFLAVPKKHKYAYRLLAKIDLDELTDMLGYEPTGIETGVIYDEPEGGRYKTQKGVDSWTVDSDSIREIIKKGSYSDYGFFVVLKALIHADGNQFLFNPEELYELEGLSRFRYEKEVVSVGNVKCSHIWYVLGQNSWDHNTAKERHTKFTDHVHGYEKS